jgi:hypothetical protein
MRGIDGHRELDIFEGSQPGWTELASSPLHRHIKGTGGGNLKFRAAGEDQEAGQVSASYYSTMVWWKENNILYSSSCL